MAGEFRLERQGMGQWRFGPDGLPDKAHSSWYEEDDEPPPYRHCLHSDTKIVETMNETDALTQNRRSMDDIIVALLHENDILRANYAAVGALSRPRSGDSTDPNINILQCVRDPYPMANRALGHISSHIGDQEGVRTCLGGPERSISYTFDRIIEPDAGGHRLSSDQCGLTTPFLSCSEDIEGLVWQAPSYSQVKYGITVCHALIGISVVGIATSLSLALWWSLSHGDPGSGFTLGSYVLTAFGVMVAIPGYSHSKTCKCWNRKPREQAKAL